jgi:ATP-dependent helicase HrpA
VFDPKLVEFRWMLEEVRVLLWARQLKTPYRTSFNRLENWRSIGVKGRSSEGMRE